MEECLATKLKAARSELSIYVEEVKGLSGDDSSSLAAFDKSQDFWVRFVAADCEAAYQAYADGSLQNVERLDYQVSHTRVRTYWLWARYLEGTISELPEPKNELCK